MPDQQIIVESDASDYAIASILSLKFNDTGEIHSIAFYSRTLHVAELNYDIHNKELLAIFDSFKVWRHYLEGSSTPIQVITDHKNLEYFTTTKVLTRRQVWWSEYLSSFNLVICYHPGKLGVKPDTITRRWDVYPKEGDTGYASANPQNFRPLFDNKTLTSSLCATFLEGPVLRASVIMDIKNLHQTIKSSYTLDPEAEANLLLAKDDSNKRWSIDDSGFLQFDSRIYVPDTADLQLQILCYYHDHILAGHFGQNWTLLAIRRNYTWPNMRTFVQDYVKSCTACG